MAEATFPKMADLVALRNVSVNPEYIRYESKKSWPLLGILTMLGITEVTARAGLFKKFHLRRPSCVSDFVCGDVGGGGYDF